MTTENRSQLLLAWLDGEGWEVDWNDDEGEITFSSPGEPAITIQDGDIITVGGAFLIGDLPVTPNLEWLALPGESCTGALWAVSEVLFN